MLLTEKEVRRVVSNYFKEKYKINTHPEDMIWKHDGNHKVRYLIVECDPVGDEEETDDT